MGFPIRSPPDHSLFAAPRGFSQLATTFIAFLMPRHPPLALISLDHTILLHTFCQHRTYDFVFFSKTLARRFLFFVIRIAAAVRAGSPDTPTKPRPRTSMRLRYFFLILSKNLQVSVPMCRIRVSHLIRRRPGNTNTLVFLEVRGFEPLTYCVQGNCSPS